MKRKCKTMVKRRIGDEGEGNEDYGKWCNLVSIIIIIVGSRSQRHGLVAPCVKGLSRDMARAFRIV